MTKITLGGNERTIQPFSAAKAIKAIRLFAAVANEIGGIEAELDRFRSEYRAQHPNRISRAVAVMRFPDDTKNVTEEDWAASGHMLELPPDDPTVQDEILHMLPLIWEKAPDELLKLIALVVVTNREYEEADRGGSIDEFLAEQGKTFEHQLGFDELFLVGEAAWETCQQQLSRAPKAKAALQRISRLWAAETSANGSRSSSSEPASSTDSPPPTTGAGTRSSTESRTSSSRRSKVSS